MRWQGTRAEDAARMGYHGAMELIIFVGLQASGKSSFYRARFAANHEHVSKDLLRNNSQPERRPRQ